GDYAVPAAANAFAGCDCLLAVGTRFSEIPTGSYSMPVPDCLIHVDINPEVFNANFPARITLEGDAAQIIPALLREVEALHPAHFFGELRSQLDDEAIVVADDGNHTFLIAELMPIHGPRRYLSPSDFNAMGYCIPATIGAKLANPDRQVVGVVGDGALRMTG